MVIIMLSFFDSRGDLIVITPSNAGGWIRFLKGSIWARKVADS